MAKSEVYSWRVAAELKAALEDAAREERTSVGELLGRMARQWLRDRAAETGESEVVQRRIRAAAGRFVGSLAGGGPPARRGGPPGGPRAAREASCVLAA